MAHQNNPDDVSARNRKLSIFVKYNPDGKYLCVEEDKTIFELDSPISKSKSFLNPPSSMFGRRQSD